MTDRERTPEEILEEYRDNYFKHSLVANPLVWEKCKVITDQALTQLQAYYREKIKKVLPKKKEKRHHDDSISAMDYNGNAEVIGFNQALSDLKTKLVKMKPNQ